jgi:hypothetical protein
VFQDYTKVFPECAFKKVNLKARMREALQQLDTGNSNEKGSNKAALQSDDVLQRLKLMDDHSKRNFIALRDKIISGDPSLMVVRGSRSPFSPRQVCAVEIQGPNATGTVSRHRWRWSHTGSASNRARLIEMRLKQGSLELRRQEISQLKEMGMATDEEFKAEVLCLLE